MKTSIVLLAFALSMNDALAQSSYSDPGSGPAAATESLFEAIRGADVRAMRSALAHGAAVNGRGVDGDTPLMYAAVVATAECMNVLLENGADPNARDRRGGTALMRAVSSVSKVRLLLDRGAEVEARSEFGITALMVAANTPGASEVVKLLISRHADVKTPASSGRKAGVPPLMFATDFGDLESVKALVAAGADVKAGRQGRGGTPLLWAANGPTELLVWLLKRGADPNAADRVTPLIIAAAAGATANVRALLDHGAHINVKDDRGTPLIHAAGSDRADVGLIALLLARGADPNIAGTRCERCIHDPPSADGSVTALMLARQRGESDIVRMLLAAGAAR